MVKTNRGGSGSAVSANAVPAQKLPSRGVTWLSSKTKAEIAALRTEHLRARLRKKSASDPADGDLRENPDNLLEGRLTRNAEIDMRVPLTGEQIQILLSLLGISQQDMGRKLHVAVDPAVRRFYSEQMLKFEALSTLLEKHDPRRSDTSQDVDDDEWVVGDDDGE